MAVDLNENLNSINSINSINSKIPSLNQWPLFLKNQTLPILKATQRGILLEKQKYEKGELSDSRILAKIILNDPVMTVHLLSFMHYLKAKNLRNEIRTIQSALVMMGMQPFFYQFSNLPIIENVLKDFPKALLNVFKIIQKAQRAADFAQNWAIRKNDLNLDEIRTAALLHPLAEILIGIFFPDVLLKFNQTLKENPGIRSRDVQIKILGFTAFDLQMLLNEHLHLPYLLKELMNERKEKESQRVKMVHLAIRLARHSAQNWNDSALPDDYAEIAKMLGLDLPSTLKIIGVPELKNS